MAIGVYKIVNKVNGKTYVGASMNICNRWAQHKTFSKTKHKNLYKDMRKFGLENFEFIVLEECTLDNLRKLELKYYSELAPEYNLKPPIQLSKKQLLEKGKSLSIALKGRKHSEETKVRISASNKGKTLSKEVKIKISTALKKYYEEHEETKVKISTALKKYYEEHGHHNYSGTISEEHKARIGASLKKYYEEHEETKTKLSAIKKKYWEGNKKAKAKVSAFNKGKKVSKETRAKMSASTKKWWENKRKEQSKDV